MKKEWFGYQDSAYYAKWTVAGLLKCIRRRSVGLNINEEDHEAARISTIFRSQSVFTGFRGCASPVSDSLVGVDSSTPTPHYRQDAHPFAVRALTNLVGKYRLDRLLIEGFLVG